MHPLPTYSSEDVIGLLTIYNSSTMNNYNVRIPRHSAHLFYSEYVCFDWHKMRIRNATIADGKMQKLTKANGGYLFGFHTQIDKDFVGDYEIEESEEKGVYNLYKV